jgi:hypothetical protein
MRVVYTLQALTGCFQECALTRRQGPMLPIIYIKRILAHKMLESLFYIYVVFHHISTGKERNIQ